MSNPEPSQIVTTVVEPAAMSPLTRFIRTSVQVIIALAAAIPTLAAIFDVSAEVSAKLTAGMGVLVTLVSALHNAFNARQSEGAIAARDVGQVSLRLLLMILAIVCLVIFTLAAHGSITTEEGFTWLGAGLVFWAIAGVVP